MDRGPGDTGITLRVGVELSIGIQESSVLLKEVGGRPLNGPSTMAGLGAVDPVKMGGRIEISTNNQGIFLGKNYRRLELWSFEKFFNVVAAAILSCGIFAFEDLGERCDLFVVGGVGTIRVVSQMQAPK